MSKFIATNTYRSYLTTYNNRLKRYLKTDLNTLEEQDTIMVEKMSLCCTDVAIVCNYQVISQTILGTSHKPRMLLFLIFYFIFFVELTLF